MSVVKPLYKQDDKTSMIKNCKAISLLTTFLKVLENVTCSRLSRHAHNNNTMVPKQSGFRKGASIKNAAFKLKDIALKSINKKIYILEKFSVI
jgi:hypothetical protein